MNFRVFVGYILLATVVFLCPHVLHGKQATSTGKLYPAGTPTRAIQDLEKLLDDYRVGNLTPADRAHNRRLKKKILHGTFDIRELCKLALDKHWQRRTQAERRHFVNLMISLLEETAVFSKEQSKGGNYKVVYLGDTYLDGRRRALTKTRVIIPSEDIEIELYYKLRRTSKGWKIYDVIVDDASLVDNYRFQFNSIITKHSYKELVKRMEIKLAELRRKSKGVK